MAQAFNIVRCELWELSQIFLQRGEAGLVGVQQLELRLQTALIQALLQAFLLTFKGRRCCGGFCCSCLLLLQRLECLPARQLQSWKLLLQVVQSLQIGCLCGLERQPLLLKLLELLVVMAQVVTLLFCGLQLWLRNGDGAVQLPTAVQLLLQVFALALPTWQGVSQPLKFCFRGLKRQLCVRLLSDLISNRFQIVLSLRNGGAS